MSSQYGEVGPSGKGQPADEAASHQHADASRSAAASVPRAHVALERCPRAARASAGDAFSWLDHGSRITDHGSR